MTTRTITIGEYKQIKRLLKIAHLEFSSLERTKSLLVATLGLPPMLSPEFHVEVAIGENLPARELVHRLGVRVKLKGKKRK